MNEAKKMLVASIGRIDVVMKIAVQIRPMEATDQSKQLMDGGKLIFCVMPRVPGAANNPTLQTPLAICHSFPEFEQLFAQAAARLPRA